MIEVNLLIGLNEELEHVFDASAEVAREKMIFFNDRGSKEKYDSF